MLEGKSHPGKCPYVFSEVMSDAIKIEEWTFALLLFNGLLNLAAIFDYRVDMSWFSKTIKKCIK